MAAMRRKVSCFKSSVRQCNVKKILLCLPLIIVLLAIGTPQC